MLNDNTKSTYTEKDMINFWKKYQDIVTEKDYVFLSNEQDSTNNGLFFSGKNSITVLRDGQRHSVTGPAFLIMYQHLQKPAGRDYYINNKRCLEGSLKRKILVAKYKKDASHLGEYYDQT